MSSADTIAVVLKLLSDAACLRVSGVDICCSCAVCYVVAVAGAVALSLLLLLLLLLLLRLQLPLRAWFVGCLKLRV